MSGFMADFDADLARPFGAPAVGGVLGSTILFVQLITASGSYLPPAGAALFDVYGVGGGGGGAGLGGGGGHGVIGIPGAVVVTFGSI